MPIKYSYNWYLKAFEQAKDSAEQLILSAEESRFRQPPSNHQWSAAECYQHLIKFGNIYYGNIARMLPKETVRTSVISRGFPPRWIWKKAADFFEPPYSFKVNTFSSMEPDPSSENNPRELLNKYHDLQNRYIIQLKKAKKHYIDLGQTKIPHPEIRFIKLKLTEQYLLVAAHQRRHQWQAEQVLYSLSKNL